MLFTKGVSAGGLEVVGRGCTTFFNIEPEKNRFIYVAGVYEWGGLLQIVALMILLLAGFTGDTSDSELWTLILG